MPRLFQLYFFIFRTLFSFFFPPPPLTGGKKGDRITPQQAMSGKSRAKTQQKRGAGRCETPWGGLKAPVSRGPEMARRTAPVTGQECGNFPEFRWNHGLLTKFALSQIYLAWGVFLSLGPTI